MGRQIDECHAVGWKQLSFVMIYILQINGPSRSWIGLAGLKSLSTVYGEMKTVKDAVQQSCSAMISAFPILKAEHMG